MIKILQGDCIEKMRELPDECVHCCVTSPPYFGLRNYGTAKWEGGVAGCEHEGSDRYYTEKSASVASSESFSEAGDDNAARLKQARWREGGTCVKCGAVYVDRQIGLEKTPEQYVAKMVEVFAEVRRVLRKDGTLWLNLGDSYNTAASGQNGTTGTLGGGKTCGGNGTTAGRRPLLAGLKQKDLIGIPWRVAFALQADGWYLRAAIPWIKRNGMPESVRDRPSQTIEYIFMLTKSSRPFYDAEAVKMPGTIPAGTKGAKGSAARAGEEGVNARPPEYKVYDGTRLRRTRDWFMESWQGMMTDEDGDPLAFVVNTRSYKGAHFATFPPKLIEPCILASTSEKGCCSKCEAPWVRVVDHTPMVIDRSERTHEFGRTRSSGTMVSPALSETVGWQASCACNADVEPCVVLDPFGGSGTAGQVAQEHGRNAVLIELNEKYLLLIEQRTGVAA